MIVTALDGQPIASSLAEAAKIVLPSSTERVTKLRILSKAFAGSPDTPFAASIERADGSIFEVKFPRQILSDAPHVTDCDLALGVRLYPLRRIRSLAGEGLQDRPRKPAHYTRADSGSSPKPRRRGGYAGSHGEIISSTVKRFSSEG